MKIISQTFNGDIENIDRDSNKYFEHLNKEYKFDIIGINTCGKGNYMLKSYTIQLNEAKNLRG